jgi:hypothetical protein
MVGVVTGAAGVRPIAASVADPGTALMPFMMGWLSGPSGVVSGVHDVPFQCGTDVRGARLRQEPGPVIRLWWWAI